MVTAGTLIGIADKKVWFVSHVLSDGLEITAYAPVMQDDFVHWSDKEYMLREDPFCDLRMFWRDAVARDRTEESYEEFAGSIFDEDKYLNDNDLWFYLQDCHGVGHILCDDPDLHERVKSDMDKFLAKDEVGSWEHCQDYTLQAGSKRPFKDWDVVYDMEAARAVNRVTL